MAGYSFLGTWFKQYLFGYCQASIHTVYNVKYNVLEDLNRSQWLIEFIF